MHKIRVDYIIDNKISNVMIQSPDENDAYSLLHNMKKFLDKANITYRIMVKEGLFSSYKQLFKSTDK